MILKSSGQHFLARGLSTLPTHLCCHTVPQCWIQGPCKLSTTQGWGDLMDRELMLDGKLEHHSSPDLTWLIFSGHAYKVFCSAFNSLSWRNFFMKSILNCHSKHFLSETYELEDEIKEVAFSAWGFKPTIVSFWENALLCTQHAVLSGLG